MDKMDHDKQCRTVGRKLEQIRKGQRKGTVFHREHLNKVMEVASIRGEKKAHETLLRDFLIQAPKIRQDWYEDVLKRAGEGNLWPDINGEVIGKVQQWLLQFGTADETKDYLERVLGIYGPFDRMSIE